ncbi:cell division protein FtsX [Boudabousia liubingyangii]|uniref:Cell division protein FtsX n=1 Tax=Boudabousia liubingyangii TaxID=1921764 RepID=A0A1Q5PQJ8_9ACTO|nr:permease-like cell division protein FtsX [Boudabousia liubingyangii]OKL48165.1 cell division protein FtsX [Boudabousia liubingyangii]OKL49806.1 cell division protein FtsX [Boudabousia liubingyangii]
MRTRLILSQAFKGLARDKGMALAIALVTFVSILFVGGGSLLRMQVAKSQNQWFDEIEVSIFMCAKDDENRSCEGKAASDEQVAAVKEALESPQMKPYVKSFELETEAQALENLKRLYPDRAVVKLATEDVMPKSFRVKLVDPNKYQVVSEEFQSRPGVAQVMDQQQVVKPLLNALNRIAALTWGLAAIMTVAAILLITTTIRLFAMSRERETAIMRLVGASNLFIQAPFILQSAIAALVGAAAAIGALFVGVKVIVQGWLTDSFPWTSFIGYKEVAILSPVLVIVSLVLVAIAAGISLAKYTKV